MLDDATRIVGIEAIRIKRLTADIPLSNVERRKQGIEARHRVRCEIDTHDAVAELGECCKIRTATTSPFEYCRLRRKILGAFTHQTGVGLGS